MAKVYQDKRPRKHGGLRPWCISYVGLDGRRHRERTNACTKEEARMLLAQKQSEVARAKIAGVESTDALKPRLFEEFAKDEYLPHCKATHTESTYKGDTTKATVVLRHLGRMTLRSIRSGDIQRYKDMRLNSRSKFKRPLRPATVNRELMFISGALSEAARRGYIERNPANSIAQLPERNDRLRWLTREEERRLLAHAPEHLSPIVRTALHSGMRLGEILRLKQSDLDFDQRLIRVGETKNHRTRYVPMNDTLHDVLHAIPRFINSPYVFTNPETGTRYMDLSHRFERIVDAAGLDDVTFHTLRHTFASRLAQLGIPIKVIQELLGHGTMQMTLRYAHLAPNNLRDAVATLDQASGTSTAQNRVAKVVARVSV